MDKLLHHLLLAALIVGVAGCELPQDKEGGNGDAVSQGDAPETVQEWHYLTITDEAPMTAADGLPGADIDAIVIHRDGEFLLAGCTEVSLFGEDELLHGENPHLDPEGATLAVREQSVDTGFVSLAGGTLLCELPLAVLTGDDVTIWEVPGDALDSFNVSFSTDLAGGTAASAGSFISTQTFTAP